MKIKDNAEMKNVESENITSGWICPKCGRVNAPFVDHCPCSENGYDLHLFENQNSDIPPACRTCMNHPSNGGDGICNCILGMMEVRY